MEILINLFALVLVLAIVWLAMTWLAGKVRSNSADWDQEWVVEEIRPGDPCPECGGAGAKLSLGSMRPCSLCDGTGVYSVIR